MTAHRCCRHPSLPVARRANSARRAARPRYRVADAGTDDGII
ncbi:MAG: hypothetical protein WKG07_13750 [Hymenobacter sp.]